MNRGSADFSGCTGKCRELSTVSRSSQAKLSEDVSALRNYYIKLCLADIGDSLNMGIISAIWSSDVSQIVVVSAGLFHLFDLSGDDVDLLALLVEFGPVKFCSE